MDYVKPKIKDTWDAICIDGSGFDSSQFACLMNRVDDKFWKLIEPLIEKIILFNYTAMASKATPVNDVKKMTKVMM